MNPDQLNLSPLMVLMLLLYGLLIAVVLVIWTALDLKKRKSGTTAGVPATAAPERKPEQPAAVQRVQEERPRPAATGRRTADSDSVVSYSVRPRVTAADSRAAPPAREQPVPPPVREPIRDPEIDFQVGRSSRQPASEAPRTVTPVRPPAPRGEPEQTPAPAGRRRSEDAFERFLRSSRDDNDDY